MNVQRGPEDASPSSRRRPGSSRGYIYFLGRRRALALLDLPLFDKVPMAPVPRCGGPPHRRHRPRVRRSARGRVLPRRGPARPLRRGRGDGDDFRAAGLPKFIVPRAPLVLDLARRDARESRRVVVSGRRRIPLGGLHQRHRALRRRESRPRGPESSLSAQAAWGRDDVLGCERSLYAAVDQGCLFVSTRRVAAADVSAPDWRTCSPAPR